MTTTETSLLSCSFCGKTQKQVAKLIAGPGVYICDECVVLCNEIIEEPAPDADAAAARHSVAEGPVEAVLPMFRGMAHTVSVMEARMAEWAQVLVRRGVPLATIAEHAGLDERVAADKFGI